MHAVWATISAIASAPLEADDCSRPRPRTDRRCRSADAVLRTPSLGAAGLDVTSVCDLVALSATRAIGTLLVCVRLRTMGRLSETRSGAVAATEGCSKSTGEMFAE